MRDAGYWERVRLSCEKQGITFQVGSLDDGEVYYSCPYFCPGCQEYYYADITAPGSHLAHILSRGYAGIWRYN